MTGISYRGLRRYLAELPDLTFTRLSVEGAAAEFTFKGVDFEIETDPWDGALWILSEDKAAHIGEMQTLREHIEQRCLSSRIWKFLKQRFA